MLLQPAGFWRRFLAQIVDAIILLTLLYFPLMWLPENAYIIFSIVVFAVYYVFFLASRWQATPGKRLMNVHIVSTDNQPLNLKHAFARWLAFGCLINIAALFPLITGANVTVGMSAKDKQQYEIIKSKALHFQKLSKEEQRFIDQKESDKQTPLEQLVDLLSGVYLVAMALTVATDKNKIGLHDRIAKTRALIGRTSAKNYA